ncbi:MAG: hypothetical protein IJJ33_03180 [Victivallales bacterium]|nr:hypothetical protein [Victivallales bacterium]
MSEQEEITIKTLSVPRVRLVLTVVLLACGSAIAAGIAGFWGAERAKERHLLENLSRNIAALVSRLHLPASPQILRQMSEIVDCETAVVQNDLVVHATLPGLIHTSLPQANAQVCDLLCDGNHYWACGNRIATGEELWLLEPHSLKRTLLGTQALLLLAVTACAGLTATLAAWRLTVYWRRQQHRIQESDRRLALAERLAVAGRISASVIHELRNPLAGIRMNAQVLAEDLRSQGQTDESLRLITQEIDRIDHYLAGLNDLHQEQPSQDARLDAAPVLQDLCRQMAARCRHANSTLTLECDEEAANAAVFCTDGELRQVIRNLVINALEAATDSCHIRISVQRQADDLLIVVQDDGPGVAPGSGDILAPFVSGKPHGSGLGLHISSRIASRHGGSLTWRNLAPHGAEFTLRLPIAL